jgi:hypothetical protein
MFLFLLCLLSLASAEPGALAHLALLAPVMALALHVTAQAHAAQ